MKSLAIFVIAFVASTAFSKPQPQSGAAEYEETPFTYVRTIADLFDERIYPTAKWVCTKNTAEDGSQSTENMFLRLFGYISKENSEGLSIPMTTPVSTRITTGADVTEEGSREMCFAIGSAFQEGAPAPTNPLVYINERPSMTVYTRKVAKFLDEMEWKLESEELRGLIEGQNLQVEGSLYFENGYNSPEDVINMRNEVWWVQK